MELQIKKDETDLVTASLREDRTKPGYVIVRVTANRAQLDMMTLRVWVNQGAGGVIRDLRLKDFIELAKAP